jgi:hypothetical protein
MPKTSRPAGRFVMQRHGNAVGSSDPKSCLNRSGYVMARLLRAGDRLIVSGGTCLRIEDRLLDEDDGELVFVLEDGSTIEITPEDGAWPVPNWS